MDDADRVCRLPDDDWQDYDVTYAAETKKRSETLLLSYACAHCSTMITMIDTEMEDLPLRKFDDSRVIDSLYTANRVTNYIYEGVAPGTDCKEAATSTMDQEMIMRWPPFKVRINEGCYERRFRMACAVCKRPFGYQVVTEDTPLAKNSRTYNAREKFAPFKRCTFVMPSKLKLINIRQDRNKVYNYKKSTTDRGKTATTTVSTIEKDAAEVEDYDKAFSFHTNIGIIKNEMKKRGVIKRKLLRVEDDEEVVDAETGLKLRAKETPGGETKRRKDRGTLGVDSQFV